MIADLVNIAQQAGRLVLAIYNQPSFEILQKSDNSALTEADIASHDFICEQLKKRFPSIPIISEESASQYDYEERKNWEYFFLVDPLDGTKEFIKRNGEFTVNIALIRHSKPMMGVIYAPVLDITYYAEERNGAYKVVANETSKLWVHPKADKKIRVVASRSHSCPKTQAYLALLRSEGNEVSITTKGSALKFGLVADGTADIYPRLAPTMEWDTAAGQIIVNEVGKQVTVFGSDEVLKYNKRELVNPDFIVS